MDASDWNSFVAVLLGLLTLTLDRSPVLSVMGLIVITYYIVEGFRNAEG